MSSAVTADKEKANAETDQLNQQKIQGSRCHRAGHAVCSQREIREMQCEIRMLLPSLRCREKRSTFSVKIPLQAQLL